MNADKRKTMLRGLRLIVVSTTIAVLCIAPRQVKDIIAQGEFGKLLVQDLPDHVIPDRWLSASAAHPGSADEKDLVVLGVGQIRDANVTTFWIFAPSKNGFRLLLDAVGHDLAIRKGRSSGYRNIEVLKATATQFSRVQFKYDGRVYQSQRGTWQPIR